MRPISGVSAALLSLLLSLGSCAVPVGPGWETPDSPEIQASEGAYPDRIHLSWSEWPGATGYRVYVCDVERGTYTAVTDEPTQGTSLDFTEYLPYMKWYFKVAAVGSAGEGEPSLPAAGWVRPTNLGTEASWDAETQQLIFSWDAVPGAVAYRLVYSYQATGVFYSAAGACLSPVPDSEGYLVFPDSTNRLTAVISRSRANVAYLKVYAYADGPDGSLMSSLASDVYIDPAGGGGQ